MVLHIFSIWLQIIWLQIRRIMAGMASAIAMTATDILSIAISPQALAGNSGRIGQHSRRTT
jgi:hypothetical protein